MVYGEIIVRYFLKAKNPLEDEVLIGQVDYIPSESNIIIIPRVKETVNLEEIMCDSYKEDYDYYTVQSIDYSFGYDKSVLVDVMVSGEYYNLQGDDDGDYVSDEEYKYHITNHKLFLDEEGYFDN